MLGSPPPLKGLPRVLRLASRRRARQSTFATFPYSSSAILTSACLSCSPILVVLDSVDSGRGMVLTRGIPKEKTGPLCLSCSLRCAEACRTEGNLTCDPSLLRLPQRSAINAVENCCLNGLNRQIQSSAGKPKFSPASAAAGSEHSPSVLILMWLKRPIDRHPDDECCGPASSLLIAAGGR